MTSNSPPPFVSTQAGIVWQRHRWPISWIRHPDFLIPPFVLGFRLAVDVPEDCTLRCYVSADERYELFLDGERISRGPERGSPDAWYYATLELNLKAGPHALFARVWALGEKAPFGQMSVQPGFLFGVETPDGTADAAWSTGLAPWKVTRIDGYESPKIEDLFGFVGLRTHVDGSSYPWGVEDGGGPGWTEAKTISAACVAHPTDLDPVRLMAAGTLPPMLSQTVRTAEVRFLEEISGVQDLRAHRVSSSRHLPQEAEALQAMLNGITGWKVEKNRRYRAIVDLRNYYGAYPHLRVSRGAGARLSISWAESLFEESPAQVQGRKGNRNEIENRVFVGYSDTFRLEGGAGRLYNTLWWGAGRYLELVVETGGEELEIEHLLLEETRYPLEAESSFACDDPRLGEVTPLFLRSLQTNAHETFIDPYHEQLNYTGDTLITCLLTHVLTRDVRLARKSVQLFHDSLTSSGLTQSRFPCRVRQFIPPFSLLWISMLKNHAWWCGEPDFIRGMLPAARSILDAHLSHLDSDGLLKNLAGWNFLDWAVGWNAGEPPHGACGGCSGPLNWLFVYTLQTAAQLETWAGETELAARYTRLALAHARATESAFWDETRHLFADDLDHQNFSEHSQCLALLSGVADPRLVDALGDKWIEAADLQRCSLYFSHYLFEAFHQLNRPDRLFERLTFWFRLKAQGFVTTPESDQTSRSDSHAWGSHPLFHFYATVLGIRPSSFGFETVEMRPQLGPLNTAEGRMVHPRGWIEVSLKRSGPRLEGTVSLPEGTSGIFVGATGEQSLQPGSQFVSI